VERAAGVSAGGGRQNLVAPLHVAAVNRAPQLVEVRPPFAAAGGAAAGGGRRTDGAGE